MAAKQYTSLTVPAETLANLNRMKLAFGYSTGRILTNEELLAELIASVEKSNPGVFAIYNNINDSNCKFL